METSLFWNYDSGGSHGSLPTSMTISFPHGPCLTALTVHSGLRKSKPSRRCFFLDGRPDPQRSINVFSPEGAYQTLFATSHLAPSFLASSFCANGTAKSTRDACFDIE